MRSACMGAFVLIAGCGIVASREAAEADLRQRAAFDLDCPEQDLKLASLGDNISNSDIPATQGVTGCQRKAVYVYSVQARTYVKNAETATRTP